MLYHFIGIKGSGMAALALILKSKGFQVQGSDVDKYVFTQEKLLSNNILILSMNKVDLNKVDFVIVGHNFLNSNEFLKVKEKGIRYIKYQQAVAQLVESHYSIAIAGTHGKTTTTSLIHHVLKESNALIGDGTGIYNNQLKEFVFEACEYQNNFLNYYPNIVLINNVDYDHVDFFKDLESYQSAFLSFSKNAKDILVINGDDQFLNKIEIDKKIYKFGCQDGNDIQVKNIQYSEKGFSADLYYQGTFQRQIELPFYGKHSVYNCLAAITIGLIRGVRIEEVISGLLKFKGVLRRFKETIFDGDIYIDDYAHHPTAIGLTIQSVKQKYPHLPIVAIFKPDRYSRIYQLAEQFAAKLEEADEVFILDFPKNSDKEDLDIDASYITKFGKKSIYFADDKIDYQRIKHKFRTIYLFMSSKDLSATIRQLKDTKKI